MLKEYFGVDLGKLGYVVGLLIGATVSVTLIYWAVFGFDTWKEEAERASDLMMAAAVTPLTQTPAQTGGAGQYVCPQDGAVGLPNLMRPVSPIARYADRSWGSTESSQPTWR